MPRNVTPRIVWEESAISYNNYPPAGSPASECKDCKPSSDCGPDGWRCICESDGGETSTNCFDEYGNIIGRDAKVYDTPDYLIKATGAKLKPIGKWIVLKQGKTKRRVSGMAKGPRGQRYAVFFVLDASTSARRVRSFKIYREQKGIVMTRVPPAEVK